MSDPLTGSFGKPFSSQVAAFRLRLRNPVPTHKWDDLDRAQHERAIMFAGATKADLIADIAAAIDKAQFQGGTMDSFAKDFMAITREKGWPGKAGLGSKKGEAWRIRVIYQTNMRTSWAAGNMAQLVELGYRYWVYRHGGSLEPRLHHLSWDGVALPPDHPFWATHAPPNGWGCSCRIRGADSEAGIRRAGGDPGKQLPDGWQSIDAKTGTQVGIDKGWDYKVGATVADDIRALTSKSVHWPYEIAKAFMAEVPERVRDDFSTGYRSLPTLADDIRRWVSRIVNARPDDPARTRSEPYRTLGLIRSDQAKSWGARLNADLDLTDVAISDSAVRHVVKQHGNPAAEAKQGQRAVTAVDFARLAEIVEHPDSVVEDRGRLIIQKRIAGETFVAIFEHLAKRRMLSLVTMFVRLGAP